MPRNYTLGRRQRAVDRTRLAILAAARELVASGATTVTTGAVATRAGVSRITDACALWASDPGLFRRLPQVADLEVENPSDRVLAERLADANLLRPGCSIKEAEDVIGAITSFAVFDRLYKDGRRSQAAVGEILMRLASTILGSELVLQGT